jgi:ribosomal protein L23
MTNNIMAKGKRKKDKQYNGQRKNKKRTDILMAKGK